MVLRNEAWAPLTLEGDSKEPERFWMRYFMNTTSFEIELTDLVSVWRETLEEHSTAEKYKRLNPAVSIESGDFVKVASLLRLALQQLLPGHKRKFDDVHCGFERISNALQLKMTIRLPHSVELHWSFDCSEIGSRKQQAYYLRDVFVQPLLTLSGVNSVPGETPDEVEEDVVQTQDEKPIDKALLPVVNESVPPPTLSEADRERNEQLRRELNRQRERAKKKKKTFA